MHGSHTHTHAAHRVLLTELNVNDLAKRPAATFNVCPVLSSKRGAHASHEKHTRAVARLGTDSFLLSEDNKIGSQNRSSSLPFGSCLSWWNSFCRPHAGCGPPPRSSCSTEGKEAPTGACQPSRTAPAFSTCPTRRRSKVADARTRRK